MKVVWSKSNEMWTGQIVLCRNGKYVVRYEGVATCPPWDRAGIDGPYWRVVAICDTVEEAKKVAAERGWMTEN